MLLVDDRLTRTKRSFVENPFEHARNNDIISESFEPSIDVAHRQAEASLIKSIIARST
jgi:hypothetical protein